MDIDRSGPDAHHFPLENEPESWAAGTEDALYRFSPGIADKISRADDPEAGTTGSELLLAHDWIAVGQIVDYTHVIYLYSDASEMPDPRALARQVAGAFPGSVVCYPRSYEDGVVVPGRTWAEQAKATPDAIGYVYRAVALEKANDHPGIHQPTYRHVFQINEPTMFSSRNVEKALRRLTCDSFAVLDMGSPNLTRRAAQHASRIDRADILVSPTPLDPADSDQLERFQENVAAHQAYFRFLDKHSSFAFKGHIGLLGDQALWRYSRLEPGEPDPFERQQLFLERVNADMHLVGYNPLYNNDRKLLGVTVGSAPISHDIIVDVPGHRADGGTQWPDEGPLWMRAPEIHSADPFAAPTPDQEAAQEEQARAQRNDFSKVLRSGGKERATFSVVGATNPDAATEFGNLIAACATGSRPRHLPAARYTVTAPGGEDAALASWIARSIATADPDGSVTLAVSEQLSDRLHHQLTKAALPNLRVALQQPPRLLAEYATFADYAAAAEPLLEPPPPSRQRLGAILNPIRALGRKFT